MCRDYSRLRAFPDLSAQPVSCLAAVRDLTHGRGDPEGAQQVPDPRPLGDPEPAHDVAARHGEGLRLRRHEPSQTEASTAVRLAEAREQNEGPGSEVAGLEDPAPGIAPG